MAQEVVVLDVQTNTSQAEGNVKSLKTQLKEATLEVQAMAEKFGATSKEAVAAAKRAAELKDKIGDAKALIDAFNPDKKFQAFSSALSGVAGGFSAVQGAMGLMGAESENVQKMMLKVQSAMALSQGLSAVTESIDAFKNLGTVLSQISVIQKISAVAQRIWNAAMSANPIGAIIAAITLLIAGITALIAWFIKSSDAAKEQTKAVNESTKAIESQKKAIKDASEALDRHQKQELALAKASGKSTEEIRKLEIALINKKIADKEATAAAALHTVELQRQQLASLKAADADDEIIKKQEENLKNARDILKSANEDVIKAGNERNDILNRHIVERAQAQTDANKKEIQKEKEKNTKLSEEIKEANKKLNEEIKKLDEENFINSIKDDRIREEKKIDLEYFNKIREITSSKASAELKAKALREIEEKHGIDIQNLKDKFAEEDKKKADEKAKELLKANEDALKQANDLAEQNYLKTIKSDAERAKQKENLDYEKKVAEINALQISEFEKNSLLQQTARAHQLTLIDIEKQASEESKKIEEDKFKHKQMMAESYSNLLSNLSNVVGKETGAGKALAIAAATIDTYQAANSALKANYGIFGPAAQIARFASVAATIAMGIKNVKSIAATKVPGGGGGGSTPSIPTSAPIAPQMSSTAMNQQMINQVGNAATRAFVLESDVSGNQERIRRLNRAARIN